MASAAGSPRRAIRTPGRPLLPAPVEMATEPPKKKRRYTPGGPGQGRWILVEEDDDELGTERVDRPRTVPRARSRKLSTEVEGRGQSRPRRERRESERYAPPTSTPRPRYSNSSSAAAASQASDGYKPREERSWEDFHPDLDIQAKLVVFSADEVDGRTQRDDERVALSQLAADHGTSNADAETREANDQDADAEQSIRLASPSSRRKPGRPVRSQQASMLSGLGLGPPNRIVPLPTHSSKERLNLPKPSFRHFSHFLKFEEDLKENKVNYVDRTMSNIGYQESDRFELPVKSLVRLSEAQQAEDEAEVGLRLESDGADAQSHAPTVGRVEYDMDEQDEEWLETINDQRKIEGLDAIKPAIFEITMTQIEKEYHALEKRIPKPQPRHAQTHRPRSSSQAAVNGDLAHPPGDEPDSKCSICDDGDCENANAIIFCDGCDLAVHQECYGVPFIPEGQWFCRKCKEIGRGTPTCIFCPNVDGAFKQTSTLRWSHLLCSIWIPEVTIANTTFMEPIMDVDKVPKSRWKLNCYICNQKMGACIQCGNKNCYLAFHVTCARRAKLFLKMKSQHQGGIDTNALKAFCDKHVPPEWRRTHDTDNAIVEAKRWYRHAMKDRKWADSQSAAVELGAPPPPDGGMSMDGAFSEDTIMVANQKRKRSSPQKLSWRLQSGAPVVPAVVYNTVELSLQRFTIRKRKEFVEKASRYWTLKREARRGAALLKRLQLQLETFSSMEITRRNFAAMGAVGRPRLLRRIAFGELLQKDMAYQVQLTQMIREREMLRLQEVMLLREQIDTIYTPISMLLQPILLRAQKLDEKSKMFTPGLDVLAHRLRERYYTSVSEFSKDISRVLSSRMNAGENADGTDEGDLQAFKDKLDEVPAGTAEHHALPSDVKELKKLVKRIVKAVQELTQEALKKEGELRGLQHEETMRKIESLAMFSADITRSIELDANENTIHPYAPSATAGASPDDQDVEMQDVDERTDEAIIRLKFAGSDDTIAVANSKPTPTSQAGSSASSTHNGGNQSANLGQPPHKPIEPLSPPVSTDSHAQQARPSTSTGDPSDVFANGGIAWYLEPFDVIGTTVHEERYTGRAVMRDMSEQLSDMDEDTLLGLEADGMGEMEEAAVEGAKEGKGKKKVVAKKKGRRNQRWGR
ncbi:hypothetical protein LTR95_003613 [Oleoguttula sp. CCFEE 5521]